MASKKGARTGVSDHGRICPTDAQDAVLRDRLPYTLTVMGKLDDSTTFWCDLFVNGDSQLCYLANGRPVRFVRTEDGGVDIQEAV